MTALAMPRLTDLDQPCRDHLEDLGFISSASYLLWCRKNGFGAGFVKTEVQLAVERQLAERTIRPTGPKPGRSHTAGRARLVKRAYRGEIPADERYPLSQKLRQLFATIEDDLQRVALYKLLKQVERHADLLSLKTGFHNRPREEGNNYEDALGQLTRHYRDWLRPVEEWFTQHLGANGQFRDLTRYLLASYEVPAFMDTAFLSADGKMAHREQEWFKHIGIGKNIRRADLPLRLTKRMAHVFPSAPKNTTIARALRWAQFIGMEGSGHLSKSLLRTRLHNFQEDEPFWETVLLFLARNPLLEGSYFGPIIDYVYYQKFAPQQLVNASGQAIEGPPAQPNFTMKGRSINKLLRLVDEWHGHLNAADYTTGETEEWESCGLRGYDYQEHDEQFDVDITWSLREMCTALDLIADGRVMHHCINTYARRCLKGEFSVFSLQLSFPDKLPQRVLTIAVNNERRTVTEYRGKYNLRPFDKKRTAQKHWNERPYLYFLQQSPRILRMWMDREEIKHD